MTGLKQCQRGAPASPDPASEPLWHEGPLCALGKLASTAGRSLGVDFPKERGRVSLVIGTQGNLAMCKQTLLWDTPCLP